MMMAFSDTIPLDNISNCNSFLFSNAWNDGYSEYVCIYRSITAPTIDINM